MNYLRYKTRRFLSGCLAWLIILGIITVFVAGLIHIVFCTEVEATQTETTNTVVAEEVIVEEPEIISLGTYKLTAYCACMRCCGKTDGITASGVKAVEGVTVAADTKVLPFGTKIIIDGHEYIVQDRGGAIKGNKIDIYFDSHQKALEFGVQYKEIFKGV